MDKGKGVLGMLGVPTYRVRHLVCCGCVMRFCDQSMSESLYLRD